MAGGLASKRYERRCYNLLLGRCFIVSNRRADTLIVIRVRDFAI